MASKKKVALNDYDLTTTLGTGSFGRVRLARNKKTGEYFAMKILKKADIIKLKQVDHVGLKGFSQDQRYLYFLMDYIPGGELFTYLRTEGKLSSEHAQFYASQVCLMFEYLHSKNIIYRDLKPENILIDEEGYLKLTDFGFAKYCETRTYTLCGTPEYLAPEVLLNKGHGKPVDWWTLGILTYEMIAGIDPFNDDDPMAIYQKILKGKIKFPRDFDKNAKSLVKHLLVADVTKRYGCLKNGANDIKNHRWFKNLDWYKLSQRKVPAPYIPQISKAGDTSNFSEYPDSDTMSPEVSKKDDPFLDW
ncbi:protein kinase domain protein [Stylonychia lemnae]|uniref:Protein kinase domain protein n=1 Tax=Stylonychia lemnae TaxID=5949 RepID=A0A078A8P5_STYLE|nr:protein kinase domain protein [Stylonychia lemnae]|eukprot:CDW77897.1 protein kinase domain protein [Stylonychia lemnae]